MGTVESSPSKNSKKRLVLASLAHQRPLQQPRQHPRQRHTSLTTLTRITTTPSAKASSRKQLLQVRSQHQGEESIWFFLASIRLCATEALTHIAGRSSDCAHASCSYV